MDVKRARLALFVLFVVMNLVVAFGLSTSAAHAQTSGGCTLYHTVQRGETLYGIARRYGNTVQHVAAFNGLTNPSRIFAGQRLCVWDNSLNPYPQPSDTTYTVQRGDTLYSIARRYGLNTYQLASFNGIWNPSRIYAGQVLRIPSGAAPVPPPVTAGPLSIIESHNVVQYDGTYWITDSNPFFLTVQATNATGTAFYLRDASGGIILLGEDVTPADGWGVPVSIPQNPFAGTVYAIAYNNQAQVAQSNLVSLRR